MNIGAITKLLLSRSATTPTLVTLLCKPSLCRFSFFVRHCQRLSKISPTIPCPSLQPRTDKPVLYHGTSSTQKTPSNKQTVADDKTSAVNIWEDLKEMRSAPLPALVLGFSGLVPFVLPPAYMIFTQTFISKLAFAQNSFGACILASLGGVRWGFVMPEVSPLKADWFNFGYSTIPMLMAWASLMMHHTTATLTLMVGIACAAYFDTAVRGYPPWFKGLRFILSMGVLLALWSVLMCKVTLLPPSKTEPECQAANMCASSLSLRAADSSEDSVRL